MGVSSVCRVCASPRTQGSGREGKMGSGKPRVKIIKRRYPLELEGDVDAKGSKFYPPEDAPVPMKRAVTHNAPKLKSSITPGTVLILLAGIYKGKRVIFLKQLKSGLLLIAGPKSVNGVPLRRVNQAYVIGTSTKVNIKGVNVDKFTDDYFKTPKGEEGEGGIWFLRGGDRREEGAASQLCRRQQGGGCGSREGCCGRAGAQGVLADQIYAEEGR